jgi:hypothetical protein
VGGRARAIALLLTLSLSGCGTTAPWYRASTPPVSSPDRAPHGDEREGSASPKPSVLVEYDRFKDDTRVYTRPFPVAGGSLTLSLHAFLHGNRTKLTRHETPLLLLGFSSGSEDRGYLESQSCIFLINGRDRVDLGDGTPSGKFQSTEVSEYLTFSVTTQMVEMLLRATTIEARLGTTEFTIAPQQLGPFRELLGMIRAPKDST